MAEDEKTRGTFSPQFENYLTVSNNNKQGEDCSVEESLEPDKCTKGTPTTSSDEISKNVAVNDLLCGICKELLYRPVVLNCGHGKCSKNS